MQRIFNLDRCVLERIPCRLLRLHETHIVFVPQPPLWYHHAKALESHPPDWKVPSKRQPVRLLPDRRLSTFRFTCSSLKPNPWLRCWRWSFFEFYRIDCNDVISLSSSGMAFNRLVIDFTWPRNQETGSPGTQQVYTSLTGIAVEGLT